jgi:hypothetical protein
MPLFIRSHFLNCWRIIFAGLVLALLGACSTTKFAYTNGHELAWWWLSDYIDVQGEDRATLRRAVHQAHDWHRREQLAGTIELLQRWQPQFAGDLPPESACRLVDEVMGRAVELPGLVQALDVPALQLLARLSPRQLAEMERQFAKSNRKFRSKYIEVSAQDLLDLRVDAGLSRAQWIYGSLGRQQEQALRAALVAAPWDARESYGWRLRRQQDVLQTLRELGQTQANPEATRSALRALLSRLIDPQEPVERARVLAMRQQSCQLMAQLHASTTAAQRAKAQDNLRNSALDLKALMPPR